MIELTAGAERYRYIDGLRGWAILLVLLIHSSLGVVAIHSLDAFEPFLRPDIELPSWLAAITGDAGHGVQLFFVVSAASLSLSLLGSERFDARAYALRRFFRIAPLFYLGLVFYTFYFGLGPRMWAPQGISWPEILATLTFVHSWFQNSLNSVVPGGWSIGDEAAFYVLLPFLLIILKASRRWFCALTAIIVVAVQIRYRLLTQNVAWSGFAYLGFPNQAPVFMLGMISGYLIHSGKRPHWLNKPALAPAIFAIMILLLPQVHSESEILQPHIRFAVLAAFLCYALQQDKCWLFTNDAIVSIGRVSFSVYILHFILLAPTHLLAAQLTDTRGAAFLLIAYVALTALSYAGALFTHHFIELPFIRLSTNMSQSRPAASKESAKRPVLTPALQ
jgi:exopolysaccharide production protein ExoZ